MGIYEEEAGRTKAVQGKTIWGVRVCVCVVCVPERKEEGGFGTVGRSHGAALHEDGIGP